MDIDVVSGFGFDVSQSVADSVLEQYDNYDCFDVWVACTLLDGLEHFLCDWYGNLHVYIGNEDEDDAGYLFTFGDEKKMAAVLRGESQELPDFKPLLERFRKYQIKPENDKPEFLHRDCIRP